MRTLASVALIALAMACSVQIPDVKPENEALPLREFTAYEQSSGASFDSSAVRFAYDQPELVKERQAKVLVEIDRITGMTQLPLAVETREGPVDLAEILGDVGLEIRLVWSDEIPATLLGNEMWPGEETLQTVMNRFQNVQPMTGEWSIYLLLIPRRERDSEYSILIDPTHRKGAVVSMPSSPEHPGEILHTIGHEIGHLLNLPHAWEVYGNTRSLMSYPWRWKNWDWSDPSIYHFDAAGRHHILHGPETRVRPGASGFEMATIR